VIGKIKIKVHRKIQGDIKTVTIITDVDQWFTAVFTDETQLISISDKSVRVGLGITSAIALNNGDLIEYLCFLRKAEERFCRERKMTQKREKAKLLPAKAWRKVRRHRDDFAHKLSNKHAREYGTIVFEDFIKSMIKNHSPTLTIMDSC
jgi:putative transposase